MENNKFKMKKISNKRCLKEQKECKEIMYRKEQHKM